MPPYNTYNTTPLTSDHTTPRSPTLQQEKYFQSVTFDCMPCLGTPATTFGMSIGVVCVLVLLAMAFKRYVYRRMNKRSRRRMRATLKIVFVFFQVRTRLKKL